MKSVRAKPQIDERFREVTGKTYILTLLQNLVRHKVLVSVYLPDTDTQYTSTVLSVNAQEGVLIADELFPQSGAALLEKAGELRLYGHFGGAALGFTTQLDSVVEEDGLRFYHLRLPEKVNYMQRRDDHRVVVARLGIRAVLYDHSGRAHAAKLYDISSGGIGLKVAQAALFHENAVYRCTLHTPGEEPFNCKVEICCRRTAAGVGEIVGGSFSELDSRTENSLRRLVAEFERRLLRLRWEPAAQEKPAGDS